MANEEEVDVRDIDDLAGVMLDKMADLAIGHDVVTVAWASILSSMAMIRGCAAIDGRDPNLMLEFFLP